MAVRWRLRTSTRTHNGRICQQAQNTRVKCAQFMRTCSTGPKHSLTHTHTHSLTHSLTHLRVAHECEHKALVHVVEFSPEHLRRQKQSYVYTHTHARVHNHKAVVSSPRHMHETERTFAAASAMCNRREEFAGPWVVHQHPAGE